MIKLWLTSFLLGLFLIIQASQAANGQVDKAYDYLIRQDELGARYALAFHNILIELHESAEALEAARMYIEELRPPGKKLNQSEFMETTVAESQFLRQLASSVDFVNSYGIGYGHLPGAPNFFEEPAIVEELIRLRGKLDGLALWANARLTRHFDFKRNLKLIIASQAKGEARLALLPEFQKSRAPKVRRTVPKASPSRKKVTPRR